MPAVSAISYTVRRSSRARRVRVNVHAHAGVEVVLPARAPDRAAAAAVAELRPWIERRLDELAGVQRRLAQRAGTLPYLDETLRLVPQRGRIRVHRRDDELLVPAAEPQRAVESWYRRAARQEIGARLDRATGLVGTSYRGLVIRGQRTRWASCSAEGSMSFNWRLLLGPETVLDYVVWHEVCHLEVLDHSPRFWRLVESRCPGYREQMRWLRQNGSTLVL